MSKRTNRVAWGLVGVLVLVLGGGGWLFASYQSRLPAWERTVTLLPIRAWQFGRWGMAADTIPRMPTQEWIYLGFFGVRVK